MKNFNKLLLSIAMLVTLFGCSSSENESKAKETDKVEESADASGDVTDAEEIEIGEAAEAVELVKEEDKVEIYERPIMVSVNNLPLAVKVQTGLAPAYLIYEVPVEGGLTRLLACFQGEYPELIGTCRSARHYMLDYVLDNDAIFCHFGWSKYAIKRIQELNINNLEGNSYDNAAYFRQNPEGLASEHTAYAYFDTLLEYIKTEKNYDMTTYRARPLKYSDTEVDVSGYPDSIPATDLGFNYTSCSTQYQYNEEEQRYYRYANGNAHVDYFTKEHYSFKNVILVELGGGYTMCDDGKNIDLKNLGDGYGYYITNGYAVPIWWEKYSPYEQMKFYLNGEELQINEGNTFIQLHLKQNTYYIN
ncbi:MAG: DUF3048 domain-containing protein [Erysipelotrichaceae bacterium]|nr:DUF3048 domain-containing protein [Erysipelotrichaceae bacterium]